MQNQISDDVKRCNYLIGEIYAAYHELYRAVGLSDSAAMILYAVLERGGLCQLRDIRKYTGLGKQTLNSAMRKLEVQGFVRLEAAGGGKNKAVRFTQAGRAFAEQTAGRIIQAENDIFASWKAEDVETHLTLLKLFMHAMREKAREMRKEKIPAEALSVLPADSLQE